MKKLPLVLLCLLFMGLCACGEVISLEVTSAIMPPSDSSTLTTIVEKATTDMTKPFATTVEINPYSEFMKTYTNSFYGSMEGYYYTLHDIDGNGIQEWFLGRNTDGGIGLCSVYAIHNGAVVRQEQISTDFTSPHQFLVFRNGILRTGGRNMDGWLVYVYYRFEAGELNPQTELYEYRSIRIDPVTRKEIPLTDEEFDRVQKEMEGDGQVVELDWKPLAEYGR